MQEWKLNNVSLNLVNDAMKNIVGFTVLDKSDLFLTSKAWYRQIFFLTNARQTEENFFPICPRGMKTDETWVFHVPHETNGLSLHNFSMSAP